MGIKGVIYDTDPNTQASICIVTDLSNELKQLIRTELSKVCHGQAKAVSGKPGYSYGKTIREFLRRYRDKTSTTKLGMLGELLCHILLFSHRTELKAASPFFNMEEGSIKKGFDLIISDANTGELWITEVKSGELGASEKNQKIRSLIDLAKNDLIGRIGSDNSTIWHSAINNVKLALEDKPSEKTILVDLLEQFLDNAEAAANDVDSINAVLVPIIFEDAKNAISLKTVAAKLAAIQAAKHFNSCCVFAIQKSTISKLESFLNDEATQNP